MSYFDDRGYKPGREDDDGDYGIETTDVIYLYEVVLWLVLSVFALWFFQPIFAWLWEFLTYVVPHF